MKTRPVLSWSDGEVLITAGTSWLNIIVEDVAPVRLRGGRSLRTFEDSLRRVAACLDSERKLDIRCEPLTLYFDVDCMLDHDESGCMHRLEPEVVRDLQSWLTYVRGGPRSHPDGFTVGACTLDGGSMTLCLEPTRPENKRLEIVTSRPAAFAGVLLQLVQSTHEETVALPGCTVSLTGGLWCELAADYGEGRLLCRTTIAAMAEVVQTTLLTAA